MRASSRAEQLRSLPDSRLISGAFLPAGWRQHRHDDAELAPARTASRKLRRRPLYTAESLPAHLSKAQQMAKIAQQVRAVGQLALNSEARWLELSLAERAATWRQARKTSGSSRPTGARRLLDRLCPALCQSSLPIMT